MRALPVLIATLAVATPAIIVPNRDEPAEIFVPAACGGNWWVIDADGRRRP